MDPKYHIGQIVKVYDYYADMIVKDVFYGLIIDVKSHNIFSDNRGPTHVYSILPGNKHSKIQIAEEFAIETAEVL